MAIDTEAKRWSMLAFASASRVIVFNPDTSGLSSIEKITVLQKYGGNAWQSEVAPEVVIETISRGGIWPDNPVEPIDWRRKSAEERRRLLERIILGLNEAPEEIQKAAAEVVEDYAPRKKTQPVQVAKAEYKRLAQNREAVNQLIKLYEEWLDQEDEALIILLSH